MTQGKIERYHRTMKNVVTLQKYYAPWELERELERFVHWYNEERNHESLENSTPADVYRGPAREVATARELVKLQTLERRRRQHLGMKAKKEEPIRAAELRKMEFVPQEWRREIGGPIHRLSRPTPREARIGFTAAIFPIPT